MFHSSPDPSIIISRWRERPPTGREMQRTLTTFLPPDELDAILAREVGRSVVYIRWCLGSEAIVPACLLAAALRVGARKGRVAPAH